MTNAPRHAAKRPAILGAIWAQAENGIIGNNGTMPWHVPEDLAHFKRTTAGHPVIMGRTTWESFPEKFRPLPGRSNIVLSSQRQNDEALKNSGALPVGSLDEALALAQTCPGSEEIWIIGGGKVYAAALDSLDLAVVTKLDRAVQGDTSAPMLDSSFSLGASEPSVDDENSAWSESTTGTRYRFETWIRTKD